MSTVKSFLPYLIYLTPGALIRSNQIKDSQKNDTTEKIESLRKNFNCATKLILIQLYVATMFIKRCGTVVALNNYIASMTREKRL